MVRPAFGYATYKLKVLCPVSNEKLALKFLNKGPAGFGLGLYIVKEAIEKLGGTVKVESQLGIGTKFIIFIPNHAG